jgi:hypothetical protein
MLAWVLAGPAAAQVIERPERPVRGRFAGGPPPDPNRPSQTLTLTFSTLGGYDDNLTPDGATTSDPFRPRESGYTGFADAALRYRRTQGAGLFEAGGRSYVSTFRNVEIPTSFGGDVQVRAATPLGRAVQLDVQADARSEPFYAPGAFTALRAEVGRASLPDANPTNGFSMRRSRGAGASATLAGQLSRRDTVTGTYRYDLREFEDSLGDGDARSASLTYGHEVGRGSGLRFSYRYSQSEFLDYDGSTQGLEDRTADLGFHHERNLSATRRLSFSFGAGASYAQGTRSVTGLPPPERVLPSGYGAMRLDLARTWSISGDYRRAVSMLEGVSAETFATDAALARVGGFVGERSEVAFSAGYSNGRATASMPGQFDSYSAAAQLRLFLTRWSAALVSHTFYSYRLVGVEDLPPGLPTRFDRNAIRVGVTMNLPLHGGDAGGTARRSGRN